MLGFFVEIIAVNWIIIIANRVWILSVWRLDFSFESVYNTSSVAFYFINICLYSCLESFKNFNKRLDIWQNMSTLFHQLLIVKIFRCFITFRSITYNGILIRIVAITFRFSIIPVFFRVVDLSFNYMVCCIYPIAFPSANAIRNTVSIWLVQF